jgi:hypothetical protein
VHVCLNSSVWHVLFYKPCVHVPITMAVNTSVFTNKHGRASRRQHTRAHTYTHTHTIHLHTNIHAHKHTTKRTDGVQERNLFAFGSRWRRFGTRHGHVRLPHGHVAARAYTVCMYVTYTHAHTHAHSCVLRLRELARTHTACKGSLDAVKGVKG